LEQRRFIAFLLLSVGAMLLINRLFPPPQPPAKPAPVAGAKANGKDQGKAGKGEADAKAKAEEPPKVAAPQPAGAAGGVPALAQNNAPLQFIALGSLDMDSDYRMLVTLTSAGAAVKRAEMASPRFRDQHNWSGYLGELELKTVPDGAQVQIVGAGTPAANATADGKPAPLEPGDVIVGVGNPQAIVVRSADDLNRALSTSKPGEDLILQVRHAGNPLPEPRTVRLVRAPFAVLRPELANYRMRDAPVPAGFVDRPSFLLTLAGLDKNALSEDDAKRMADLLEAGNWELRGHDETMAIFRRVLPELQLEVIKRYTLDKAPASERNNPNFPAYHLRLDVELHNASDGARSVAYQLDGATGMPLEGWWYAHKISQTWLGGAGLRDVAFRFFGNQARLIGCPTIAAGTAEQPEVRAPLAYAGVDGQYFSAVLIPQMKSLDEVWFDSTEAVVVGPKPDPRMPSSFTNVTCRLTRDPIALGPGATHRDSYQVFIGPKRPGLLARYYPANDPNYSLKDLIYYGWPIFGAVARAMTAILHFFHDNLVHNYGIAIVMLTVLVRGSLFPISFKQTKNMARLQERMRALKNDPEFNRINEKYKNDMQKRSQATQELYRKHGINPMDQLGGCLPLFLQLPIFIGLYRALMVDVELRQSPLFGQAIRWCSDLAAPDMLWNWSIIMPDFITSGQGIFGLGPYLNVLPLVTVALFLLTQKMAMSPPTNEQEAMQQKMMKYMTIFMGVMFYKVASGLCLYFIVSSLWGIAERKLLPKPKPADTPASGATPFGGGKKRPDGGSKKGPDGDGSKASPNGSPSTKKSKAKRKK
jgi:YidC/Oxa1 family membrane protein insertase